MELNNCDRCGKLQLQKRGILCTDCQQLYFNESRVIKEYIKMNPRATMMDIVQHTGLSVKRIKEIII
ncbi:hypothetical protein [Cohnella abietis]|uniref:Flagellar protein n=1 Tax=Cohnella abietis TaxID=2507935 RepID=A0A3T1CZU3_9BACL|nr:hypothetical protein [Cohnella abietis]BBI31363.1 hypothetical protein KCTCHS21_07620 [Cohnella abietis]